MSRPIVATIDHAALRHNLAVVRKAAPAAHIWSVVKANAYGHGLARCWRSLSETDGFALLNVDEALLLRHAGFEKPILLLEGFFHQNELPLLDRYRLTTCVHSEWQIAALASVTLSAPLDIYLKVNSDMNRLGFQPQQVPGVWRRLMSLASVRSVTLMAHFAAAEKGQLLTAPMQRIEQASAGRPLPRSLANSAATLWHPQTHSDWIRPGIILYGASPSGCWQDIAQTGLQPVMTLSSRLIAIQDLQPGDGVSYGYRYHSDGAQRIGVVACGYADGYPRHAPTGTPVMVDGIRTRTLGTICMDMLMVDLTPCPQAAVGSPVELWGNQVKIDDVASAAGTVGYELMCALAARVPVKDTGGKGC